MTVTELLRALIAAISTATWLQGRQIFLVVLAHGNLACCAACTLIHACPHRLQRAVGGKAGMNSWCLVTATHASAGPGWLVVQAELWTLCYNASASPRVHVTPEPLQPLGEPMNMRSANDKLQKTQDRAMQINATYTKQVGSAPIHLVYGSSLAHLLMHT